MAAPHPIYERLKQAHRAGFYRPVRPPEALAAAEACLEPTPEETLATLGARDLVPEAWAYCDADAIQYLHPAEDPDLYVQSINFNLEGHGGHVGDFRMWPGSRDHRAATADLRVLARVDTLAWMTQPGPWLTLEVIGDRRSMVDPVTARETDHLPLRLKVALDDVAEAAKLYLAGAGLVVDAGTLRAPYGEETLPSPPTPRAAVLLAAGQQGIRYAMETYTELRARLGLPRVAPQWVFEPLRRPFQAPNTQTPMGPGFWGWARGEGAPLGITRVITTPNEAVGNPVAAPVATPDGGTLARQQLARYSAIDALATASIDTAAAGLRMVDAITREEERVAADVNRRVVAGLDVGRDGGSTTVFARVQGAASEILRRQVEWMRSEAAQAPSVPPLSRETAARLMGFDDDRALQEAQLTIDREILQDLDLNGASASPAPDADRREADELAEELNSNGRIYPRSVWLREVARLRGDSEGREVEGQITVAAVNDEPTRERIRATVATYLERTMAEWRPRWPRAMDIVSVQPMTGPVGSLFYTDYTYGAGGKRAAPPPYPPELLRKARLRFLEDAQRMALQGRFEELEALRVGAPEGDEPSETWLLDYLATILETGTVVVDFEAGLLAQPL